MKRIDNLTGVRAMAALWVVIFHASLHTRFSSLRTILDGGWMGVDIFYVLSGLVLSLVYASKLPLKFDWFWYRSFLSRRIAKIYPLHVITFCLMAGLILLAYRYHYHFVSRSDNSLWNAVCSLLMVHSLGLTQMTGWNEPSWSVSAEWIAYSALFAPMVFLLRRVRIVFVAILATVLWTSLILLTALMHKSNIGEFATNGVLRIIPEFLGGYLLFRLLQARPWKWGDLVSGAGLLLVVTVALSVHRNEWLLLPSVMILLGGLYTGGRFCDRIFGNRLMIMLGDASYSIYLIQSPVYILAHQITRRMHLVEDIPVALFEAALVSTAGVLVFRYVEEPSRQRLLRFFKRKLPSQHQETLIQSGVPAPAETTSVAAAT